MFSNEDESILIVSIKGTSAGLLGGGGSTTDKDKINASVQNYYYMHDIDLLSLYRITYSFHAAVPVSVELGPRFATVIKTTSTFARTSVLNPISKTGHFIMIMHW